jgi:hypothetical protein
MKELKAALHACIEELEKMMQERDTDNVKQPNRGDSKILEDLGLLCEEADDVSKLDDRLMDVLLRSHPRDEDVYKEMQSSDECASKYKTVYLYVQRWLSGVIKKELDRNSVSNARKRKFKLPTLELKKFGDNLTLHCILYHI